MSQIERSSPYCKSLSDIAERRLPQDGRIRQAVRGQEIDFRVSTVPSLHGETVVLRILDRAAEAFVCAKLGLPPPVIARFQVTLEDAIEYRLHGITQMQVHEQIGLTFAEFLSAIVRQDPDVIMVGEIRNQETAQVATQAALLGLLVLSTLHTNSAAAAVTRLRDMGLEELRTLLVNGVSLISALGFVRDAVGNRAAMAAIDQATASARAGRGLALPLAEARVFPLRAAHLLRLGEENADLGPTRYVLPTFKRSAHVLHCSVWLRCSADSHA